MKCYVLNTSHQFWRPSGFNLGASAFLFFTNLCTSEIARVVQGDLNRVVQWMESNRIILNQSKTKSMLFGSWPNLAKSPNFCIQLYGKTLERVAKFSYLRVFWSRIRVSVRFRVSVDVRLDFVTC